MSHRYHLCWPQPQLATKFKKHMEGRQGSFVLLIHKKTTYFTEPSNPPPFCRTVREWEWVRLFARRGVIVHSGFVCQLPHRSRQLLLYSSFFLCCRDAIWQVYYWSSFSLFTFFLPLCFLAFFSILKSINGSIALLYPWENWTVLW